MGMPTELFRRTKGARQSLHPTNRIGALGSPAYDLTAGHKALHPFTGRVLFADVPPGALIELVEPIDESSPATCFIEDARGGLHHFCHEADDLDSTIKHFRKHRRFPSHRPLPRSPLAGVVSFF